MTTASVLLTGTDPVDVGADVSDGTAVSLFDTAGKEVDDDMDCIVQCNEKEKEKKRTLSFGFSHNLTLRFFWTCTELRRFPSATRGTRTPFDAIAAIQRSKES